MQGVPAMPTYQPAYAPMEGGPMPAVPLPPQPIKRPLTITSPEDDGSGAAAAQYYQQQPQMPPMQQLDYQQQQQQQQQYAYQGYGQVEYGGEQQGAPGGGRRYSAVTRQGM